MLVKCKGCNNKIERNQAHKVVINGKNEYYCTVNEYIQIQEDKEIKAKLLEKINLIFNETVVNTVLYKDLKALSEMYTYKLIYNYIIDNENKLIFNMNKHFDSQFGKIKYFIAILKNNLSDCKLPKEEVTKEIEYEHIEMKYKPKQRKKCLNDYINDLE